MQPFEGSSFHRYYSDVAASGFDPLPAFAAHREICGAYFSSLPEGMAGHRYAPGKWSVREVLGHVADSHLVFFYRMVALARGEAAALPGYDENVYAANAPWDGLPWRSVLKGYHSVMQAIADFIPGFDAAAWSRQGAAADTSITPARLLGALIGHERHHIRALKERYGLA